MLASAALHAVGSFFGSTFGVAFISASVGAFAGAFGAQVIAERASTRRRHRGELANIKRAVTLAYSITNTYIAVKKQHAKPLKEKYLQSVMALEFHRWHIAVGLLARDTPFEYEADF